MSDVALVIVNYRCAADTNACIDAVQRTAGPTLSEVVVVDNDSGDGSVEQIRLAHPEALVLAAPQNRGFASGVNLGVAETTAEHLLLLNPDCEVQDGAVHALLRRMGAEPRLGVTGPLLLDGRGNPRHDAFKAWPGLWSFFVSLCLPIGHALMGTPLHPELLTYEQIHEGRPVARVCGSALFVRRRAWQDAGPMDDGYFMYFEEVEWQRRVVAEGWSIAMTPDARAVHLVQGGQGLETVPVSYVRSAFRYHRQRGHSSSAIAVVALTAIAISELALVVAAVSPRTREKSRRMGAGYRRLAQVARSEGRAA